ncbi:MAG: type II toxin-antitoxin system Phd/YefM family antitoxin [Pseudomonadota bacterium]
MSGDTWTIARAKAQFSEVLERARSDGPQLITKHGRKAAIIVSAEEWERRTTRKGSLADFFAASPLRGSGLKIERSKELPEDLDL